MSQGEECCAAIRADGEHALKALYRVVAALNTSGCMLQPAIAQTSSFATVFTSLDPAVQTIRSRLTQRLSGLPKIDEISASSEGRPLHE